MNSDEIHGIKINAENVVNRNNIMNMHQNIRKKEQDIHAPNLCHIFKKIFQRGVRLASRIFFCRADKRASFW